MLEDNKYALSVHTRNVSAADLPLLDELVQGVLEEQACACCVCAGTCMCPARIMRISCGCHAHIVQPLLRRSEGRHVIELKPQVQCTPPYTSPYT